MKGSLTHPYLLALALAVPIGFGLGFCLRGDAPPQNTEVAQVKPSALDDLFIWPEKLNFGEVYENREFKWVLPIQNRGTRTVEISQFISSCTCSSITPKTLSIAAGQTQAIELTLDLIPKLDKSHHGSSRDFQLQLIPVIHAEAENGIREKKWLIGGRVKQLLTYDKGEVDFGRHSERSQPVPPQRVVVTSLGPVERIKTSVISPHFQVSVTRLEAEYKLEVAPKGKIPIGLYRFEVHMVAEIPGRNKVTGREITVFGEIATDIQASPPQVNFGARQKGQSCEETITLRSITKSPFKVLGVRVEGSEIVVNATENEASTPAFLLRQRVDQMGDQTGSVIFCVTNHEGAQAEIHVPVQYHGIETKDS